MVKIANWQHFPFIGALLLALIIQPASAEIVQDLSKEIIVNAGIEQVWTSWTTVEGLKFTSAQSNVELRPGGAYEWFLDLEPDEFGRRGGEGSKILVVMPHDLLAFSWTFPPNIKTLRQSAAKTQVVVRLEPFDGQRTRVRLDVSGWGQGADWQAGRRYFDRAWDVVLKRLAESFTE